MGGFEPPPPQPHSEQVNNKKTRLRQCLYLLKSRNKRNLLNITGIHCRPFSLLPKPFITISGKKSVFFFHLKSNSLPPDNKNVRGHLLNLKKIKNFFIKKYNKVRKKKLYS